jgi:hypothetical protein
MSYGVIQTGAVFQAERRISGGSVLSPGNSTLDPSPGTTVSDLDDAFNGGAEIQTGLYRASGALA